MLVLGLSLSGTLSIKSFRAESENSRFVTKTSFGEKWPFPSEASAEIKCTQRRFDGINRPIVTIEIAGRTYGLNGAAMGAGGYPDFRVLLARDPASGAYVLGATDKLIKMGLSLCRS
jgi:hypothetical protein